MSADDRIEFIRHVMQSAPPGQFETLLNDIETLAGSSSTPLEKELLEEIRLQHEHQTCYCSSSNDNDAVAAAAAAAHPLTASLRAQLQQQKETDTNATATTTATTTTTRRESIVASSSDVLVLRTYAERIEDDRYRTGSWTGEWTIRSSPKQQQEEEAEVSGQVRLCAYSFEDGNNIQVRSTHDFTATTVRVTTDDEGNDALLARAIIEQISQWEEQIRRTSLLQGGEESSYHNTTMLSQKLKSIRGILPRTKARLNWNVITQRTIRNLQETVNVVSK